MRRVLPALMVLCLVLAICIDALAALPGALGAVVQPTPPVPFCGIVGDPDRDCDGWLNSRDCDDMNPVINPAAPEVCDNVDNDCDGLIDGPDNDFDGSPSSCDCDDGNAVRGVGPRFSRQERQCDNVDNDCDGQVDESANCDTDWSSADTASDSAVNDTDADTDVPVDTDADAGGDSDIPPLDCRDPSLTAQQRLNCVEDKAEAAGLCSTGGGPKTWAVVMIGIMMLGFRRRS